MISNKRFGAGHEDLSQTFTGADESDFSRFVPSPYAPNNMRALDANMKNGDSMLSRRLRRPLNIIYMVQSPMSGDTARKDRM